MPRYPIVIEKGESNYSAYAPDVPGCVAVGTTFAETKRNMASALAFHIEGLRIEGQPVPEPHGSVAFVEIAA